MPLADLHVQCQETLGNQSPGSTKMCAEPRSLSDLSSRMPIAAWATNITHLVISGSGQGHVKRSAVLDK